MIIWSEWLDWLIRLPCPLCQRPAASGSGCFCPDCHDQLHHLRYQPWCSLDQDKDLPIYAWGYYKGTLRRTLQQLKYKGQARIGLTLGRWLGECWRQAGSQKSQYKVVPIPLHAERLQERGYNQAQLISRGFCEVTGLGHRPRSLLRIRATQRQYELTMAERQENIQGAFEAHHRSTDPVLLIDDIYTTGATVRAAAQTLRAAGVRVAGVIVIARVPPRDRSASHPIPY